MTKRPPVLGALFLRAKLHNCCEVSCRTARKKMFPPANTERSPLGLANLLADINGLFPVHTSHIREEEEADSGLDCPAVCSMNPNHYN